MCFIHSITTITYYYKILLCTTALKYINGTRIGDLLIHVFNQTDARPVRVHSWDTMNNEQSDLSLLGYANQARDFSLLGLRVLFYSIN